MQSLESLEEQIISKHEKISLYKKMQNLDEKTREVIYLRITGELSFKEIGIIMNKTDLVNAIANEAKLTKVQAKAALEAALCAVGGTLAKGDKVALIGFGTFAVVEKGERQGVNPATKEKITIPARKVIKFKAGAELAGKVK